ncbi:hypothetical protein D3C76_1037060 [compost metagenome]
MQRNTFDLQIAQIGKRPQKSIGNAGDVQGAEHQNLHPRQLAVQYWQAVERQPAQTQLDAARWQPDHPVVDRAQAPRSAKQLGNLLALLTPHPVMLVMPVQHDIECTALYPVVQ